VPAMAATTERPSARSPMGAVHPSFGKDVHQESARPQRFAPLFQNRKGNRGGGGHERPGEKAPVQETHRQSRIHGCRRASHHPFKDRGGCLKVVKRLSRRPEHTAACEQGTNQNSAPIEKFQTWLGCCPPKAEFPYRADRNGDCDQEEKHHHPLPQPPERMADDGFAGFREVLR